MKMKISNYIAGKLVEEGISQAFMVTGGGACIWTTAWGTRRGFTVSITTMSRHAHAAELTPGFTTASQRCASPPVREEPMQLPVWWGDGWIPFPCWYCRGRCAMIQRPGGPVWASAHGRPGV